VAVENEFGEPVAAPATIEALELPRLLAVVAQLAASDLGRERILALAPCADAEALAVRRGRFSEAARLLVDQALVPSFELPLADLLERLTSGRPPLDGPDLVRLADLLRATGEAVRRIAAADPPCPQLATAVAPLPNLASLAARIGKVLDRRGEVREDASPALAVLRAQIRRVRDQIYRTLSAYMTEHRDDLAEETVPLRGGRLVLLQHSGAGTRGGLVHGRSATGKSLYFEPLAAVESNNSLQQAMDDEAAEKHRILVELVTMARESLPALAGHGELLGELDLLQAAVHFGEVSGGRLAETGDAGELRLLAARHPLIDPSLSALRSAALGQPGHAEPVVPLDLELSPNRRVLVITGPNAGGKTVALKTAGLLCLAANCGLPIPAAAGSRVPVPRRVVATVGDEQELLADRSTFSGRLLRLREAWEAAGPASFILLDELGSGTDPDEGAALAVALLEGLLERGALGIITTHLSKLAAAALELPGAGCAAMEFDGDTGRPTFRLVPGPPGGSEARDLRRLLAEVEAVRREVSGLRERLGEEVADTEILRGRLVEQERAMIEERRAVAKRSRAELDAFRRETGDRLRQEVERIATRFEAGRRRGLAAEAVETLFAAAPKITAEAEEVSGPLVVGSPVRHRTLGWQGTLEELAGDRAAVRVRGKRVRCPADELMPAAEEARTEGARPRRPERSRSPAGADDLVGHPAGAAEINLIGQRVEPALAELDVYLDQALLAARREVRVIHGHGTGKLREAVRSHLRSHPAVAQLRAGEANEGGNGATVVTLRGA
jgi:DNA mismatch repair protein MutS2